MNIHRILYISSVIGLLVTHASFASILIATAGPFTGRNVFRGEQIQRGAEMAVADINAAGGLLGQHIELVIADDSCDPDQAVAVAEKLVDDGVTFVAGHVCSHSSIPASKIYDRANVLMISPASTSPILTEQGGANIFRVCGRDDEQGRVASDYIGKHWASKRIAILHDGSIYGKGLAEETKAHLNREGIEEVMFEEVEQNRLDFSALIDRVKDLMIDVVYFGTYSQQLGLFLRQSREHDLSVQVIGGDALTNDEFWLIAGEAANGTRFTFQPDPRLNIDAANLIRRFRKDGFEPAGYTLHTYAAIQIWARAVEIAGTTQSDRVSASLRGNRYSSVIGDISFNDIGDASVAGFIWYEWNNGRYQPAH